MGFKFEKLEVWQMALEYCDLIYEIADQLPRAEDFNLRSQIVRAATSIALNIAEGSTGQTNDEQARFLGLAIRSAVETIACQHLIARRGYLTHQDMLRRVYAEAESLVVKPPAFRRALSPQQKWLREKPADYSDIPE